MRLQSHQRLILAMILIGQVMIVLDASIVTTALPTIQSSLHFSSANLSWVQNAYTLTFGGLLLLGARAGDILGRRRVFTAGIAGFTLASLAGGLAQSSEWLLIARAVQGVAAAVAAPSTLALLTQSFQEPSQRARAIALYGSVGGAGASFGLVVGGLLTSWISWRWGLFINVPIGIALVILAPRYLPETERHTGHFDLVGALTSTAGMALLVYGFVRASSEGWTDVGTIAAFVIGLVSMVVFVLNELRVEQPITPLHLFASRERSGALVSRLLMVSGMFSMFFFISQYLQRVLHYSALKAGLAFLPLTGLIFAMVQVVPKLQKRFSNARIALFGLTLGFVSLAWLTQLSDATPYFPGIAIPMMCLGVGLGLAFIPNTSIALFEIDSRDAGAASGLVNVSQQLGGSLGLGILISVYESASRRASHHPVAQVGSQLEANHELAHGVSAVLMGSTLFMLLAVLAIAVSVPRSKKATQTRPSLEEVARIEMAG